MGDTDEASQEWSRRLEQDGASPPHELVTGCISLFGASPAYVFGYRSGRRWTVVAQEGQLIGRLTAALDPSAHDAENVGRLDGWVLGLDDLAELRLAVDAGADAAAARWSLRFRSGRKIKLPLRARASSDEREITGRLVSALRDRWAAPEEERP
jgi:hypothetical protein